MLKEYRVNSLEETRALAKTIADSIAVGQVITLRGTLGAGKTYFASCLINHLMGKKIDVVSPTFNIVKEYETPEYSIYHFDLYRLKNKEELLQLDIENAFENGVSLVEWPEVGEDVIYNVSIDIRIDIVGENERVFKIEYFR